MADKDVFILGIPKCRLEDGTESDILMDIPLDKLDDKLTEENEGLRVYNKKNIYDDTTTPPTLLFSKGWYEVKNVAASGEDPDWQWSKVTEGGGGSVTVDDETIKQEGEILYVNLSDQFSVSSSEGIQLSGPVPAGTNHTIEFAVDETDPEHPVWGYKKDGADTVIPFKTGGSIELNGSIVYNYVNNLAIGLPYSLYEQTPEYAHRVCGLATSQSQFPIGSTMSFEITCDAKIQYCTVTTPTGYVDCKVYDSDKTTVLDTLTGACYWNAEAKTLKFSGSYVLKTYKSSGSIYITPELTVASVEYVDAGVGLKNFNGQMGISLP